MGMGEHFAAVIHAENHYTAQGIMYCTDFYILLFKVSTKVSDHSQTRFNMVKLKVKISVIVDVVCYGYG